MNTLNGKVDQLYPKLFSRRDIEPGNQTGGIASEALPRHVWVCLSQPLDDRYAVRHKRSQSWPRRLMTMSSGRRPAMATDCGDPKKCRQSNKTREDRRAGEKKGMKMDEERDEDG